MIRIQNYSHMAAENLRQFSEQVSPRLRQAADTIRTGASQAIDNLKAGLARVRQTANETGTNLKTKTVSVIGRVTNNVANFQTPSIEPVKFTLDDAGYQKFDDALDQADRIFQSIGENNQARENLMSKASIAMFFSTCVNAAITLAQVTLSDLSNPYFNAARLGSLAASLTSIALTFPIQSYLQASPEELTRRKEFYSQYQDMYKCDAILDDDDFVDFVDSKCPNAEFTVSELLDHYDAYLAEKK